MNRIKTTAVVSATMAALALAGCCVQECSRTVPAPKYVMSFADGAGAYKSGNYQDRLQFERYELKGEKCCAVTAVDKEKSYDTAWNLSSAKFPVKAGSPFAIKVRAAGETNMECTYGGTQILWLDADGKNLKTTDPMAKVIDFGTEFGFRCRSGQWTETTIRGVVPSEARQAMLTLGGDNPNITADGSVILSSVEYYEADDAAELVFPGDWDAPVVVSVTPCRPCADFDAPIVFKLTDASKIKAGSVKLLLDDKDVTDKLSKSWFRETYTYRHDRPWKEGEVHKLTISACDEFDNALCEDRFAFFTATKTKHPKYAVRDDGMILKDGQPIFVLSISSVKRCQANGESIDQAVKDLHDGGFNVVTSYERPDYNKAEYEALCDACLKYGMPFVLEPATRVEGPEKEKQAARDAVVQKTFKDGRDLGCTFCWETGDDTASHRKPWQVMRDHYAAKAIDDDMLTVQSDISHAAGRYYEYAHATDVFKLEVYPMRAAEPQPKEMAELKHDIDIAWYDLDRSGAKNRSIWAIPQAFDGWGLWKRYPTYEEIRAETFISIANRVRGISFYSYCSGNRKWGARLVQSRWDELCKIMHEVRSYEKDLASRDASVQPKAEIVAGPKKDALGQFPVSFLLKETGFFVAASTAFEPITVRFTMPDGSAFEHVFPRNGVLVKR